MKDFPSVYSSKGGKQITNARLLYAFLELADGQFNRWAKIHITDNKFAAQGADYQQFDTRVELHNGGSRIVDDYALTLSFAKKVAMASDSPKGEVVRDYFLACEQRAMQLAPVPYYLPQTKAEALRALAEEIEAHEATQLQLEAAKPKVEQYERTMNADGTFTVADVAKMIGTGQNRLFAFLRQQKILFFDRRHNNVYQQYVEADWFIVRQQTYPRGDKRESYPQLFVTPKGVEAIRKKWDSAQVRQATIPEETAFQSGAAGRA